ncbi:CD80-like immunoglobulin C2-set [Trinorchestia longiramus]|nr:CD80-like immunoglobulin C2-set [Trinorchestia longiramus]
MPRAGLQILLVSLGVTFIALLTGRAHGLRLDTVHVPYHQVTGVRVRLECPFVLEGEQLYSVKWYRGAHEFFRYVPAGTPSRMQNFDLPGVKVDTTASDERTVELLPVTLQSSGTYKCEVSADVPSFFTISQAANMLVVEPPAEAPEIVGLRDHYSKGGYVNATCISYRSRPAASLTWYINNKQAPRHHLVQYAPRQEEGLETALLGVTFRISLHHTKRPFIVLNCTASIAAVYWRWSAMRVRVGVQDDASSSALESKVVLLKEEGQSSEAAKRTFSNAVLLLIALLWLPQLLFLSP